MIRVRSTHGCSVYGRVLVEVGIDLQYVKQVLGDDNWIRLWIDIWYGNQSLKVIYLKSHIIAADMDASAISYLEFQNKRQAQEISDLFFTLIIRKRFS